MSQLDFTNDSSTMERALCKIVIIFNTIIFFYIHIITSNSFERRFPQYEKPKLNKRKFYYSIMFAAMQDYHDSSPVLNIETEIVILFLEEICMISLWNNNKKQKRFRIVILIFSSMYKNVTLKIFSYILFEKFHIY